MTGRYWIAVPVVALAAGIAHAGVITQTVNYDIAFSDSAFPTFDGFDDQGGTLKLERLTFDWDLNYDIDYRLENTGPTAISAGDFVMAIEYYNIHQLGVGGDYPAYGTGGMYLSIEDVALAAYDETPGGDDTVHATYSESYLRTLEFTAANDPTFIDAVSQPGPLETLYGGFGGIMFFWINEPVGWDPPSGPFGEPIYPIDDAVWIFLESARHSGTVTVTYEYSLVPEPATAGIASALGLLLLRRRRAAG